MTNDGRFVAKELYQLRLIIIITCPLDVQGQL